MKPMQWRSSKKCIMTEAHGASREQTEKRLGRWSWAAWPRSEGSGHLSWVMTAVVTVFKMNKLLKKYLLRINLVIYVFKNNQLFKMRNWREKMYGGLVTKSCLTLATPWMVACQAPLSMTFSSKNTGVDCHFLLQGIFTQGLSPSLQHCRQILYTAK